MGKTVITALQDKEIGDNFYGESAVEAEIAKVRRIMTVQNSVSWEYCMECDEEIPAKRRELVPGCERCVFCQETYDRMHPRRAGMSFDESGNGFE